MVIFLGHASLPEGIIIIIDQMHPQLAGDFLS